jgi:hypothetical protein
MRGERKTPSPKSAGCSSSNVSPPSIIETDQKFNDWCDSKHKILQLLVPSVMHPTTKQHIESHVLLIQIQELPLGFRVLDIETVPIMNLSSSQSQDVREIILNTVTTEPKRVVCVVMFSIEHMLGFKSYNFSEYSNIAEIDKDVISVREIDHEGLIKRLNR